MRGNRVWGALLAAGLMTSLAVAQYASGAFSRSSANTGNLLTLASEFVAGELYGWGDNSTGQLGLGNNTGPRLSPVKVGALATWTFVETRNQPALDSDSGHTCALQKNDTLWCWGRNTNGQLGRGNYTDSYTPVQVTGSWSKVALGGMHTCGIRTTGTLWCWGQNDYGQVGIGSATLAFTSPQQVGSGTNWTEIAAGNVQNCGIRGGAVYCWGEGVNYKLGNNSTAEQSSPVTTSSNTTHTQITVGRQHACALRSAGTLWCWGSSANGQQGRGNTTTAQTPAQVGALTTWTAIAAGRDHTCGLQSGALWCWGLNTSYELGLGHTTSPQTSPVQIAAATDWMRVTPSNTSTCANNYNRVVYCWGANADGQLGHGGTATETTPRVVSGRTGVVYAGSSGTSTTFAISPT
ncbi:hypothetical protein GCM10010124_35610 [Pilimelia terevasa]|uniref:RCC1-like domain-containing protein n=1 Tax=Pilimelia terevasa TaxID=53372 RepID=A0A8J3BQ39_9ACTN|nr:RCC1 domain-containing protein [Pilimelia terevasa]GGK39838.1 hypothetical protein GCM10010124_35610 [Pilimelia terevasa]